MPTTALVDLPLETLIFPLLDCATVMRIECASKALADVSRRESEESAWPLIVRRQWGPVSNTHSPTSWRNCAIYLDTVVRDAIRKTSVKRAVQLLVRQGMLPSTDSGWHETLRCLLGWCTLEERRRVTAFVCADWQPKRTVACFLAPFAVRGTTPEEALRGLLLRFPFLPIDAGSGADRVIGAFSVAFLRQNREALAALRLSDELLTDPQYSSSSSDDDGDSHGGGGGGGGGDDGVGSVLVADAIQRPTSQAQARRLRTATALVPRPHERAARDAIYTLTYSLIMLNTDLHNPAVRPKIAPEQYAASCRRCRPLCEADSAIFLAIYSNILRRPLQISQLPGAGAAGADDGGSQGDSGTPATMTALRSMEEGDDLETRAVLSRYSTIGLHRGVASGGVALPDAASSDSETVAAAYAAVQAAAMRAADSNRVALDWSVAYYNVVDMGRYVKAASWRVVTRHSHRILMTVAAAVALVLSCYAASLMDVR